MKQCAKLLGEQGVEYLNFQVAGTCIYDCKLGANGRIGNIQCGTFIAIADVRHCPDSHVSRDRSSDSRTSFTKLQFQLHRWHTCALAVWR
jgi:hypothetical protein